MGGLPKLRSIKAIHVDIAESDGGGPPNPVDVTLAFPDRMHVDVQTPQGALTIVATPDDAFMTMAGMGSRSMPPAQKNEMLSQLHHDLVYVAQHADDPTFTFTAAGTEKIGDVDAAILDIGGADSVGSLVHRSQDRIHPPRKIQGHGTNRSLRWRVESVGLAHRRWPDHALQTPEQTERPGNQHRRNEESRTQSHT